LSERWISHCQRIVQTLAELAEKKGKDRLELIKILLFTINALHRSIEGWRNWVQNLQFMSKFTEEELAELEHRLIESTRAFIEYDIEVTEKYMAKIPTAKYTLRTDGANEDRSGLYA
jgi:hypothetical protein